MNSKDEQATPQARNVGNELAQLVEFLSNAGHYDMAIGCTLAMYITARSDEDRKKVLTMYMALTFDQSKKLQEVLAHMKIEQKQVTEALVMLRDLAHLQQTQTANTEAA